MRRYCADDRHVMVRSARSVSPAVKMAMRFMQRVSKPDRLYPTRRIESVDRRPVSITVIIPAWCAPAVTRSCDDALFCAACGCPAFDALTMARARRRIVPRGSARRTPPAAGKPQLARLVGLRPARPSCGGGDGSLSDSISHALRTRRAARLPLPIIDSLPRRHGGSLSSGTSAGSQPVALSSCRPRPPRSGAARTVSQRGAHRPSGLAPQCVPRLRHRRVRRPPVSLDGVRRRRRPRELAAPDWQVPGRQSRRHCAPVVRGTRRRPSTRRHPPRSEAGQHHARRGWSSTRDGFRSGRDWEGRGYPCGTRVHGTRAALDAMSPKSDIFALGLVITTLHGPSRFTATTVAELVSQHDNRSTPPSSVVTALDPAIRSAIPAS